MIGAILLSDLLQPVRAASMNSATKNIFKNLFAVGVPIQNAEGLYQLQNYIVIIVIGMVCSTPIFKMIKQRMTKKIEKKGNLTIKTAEVIEVVGYLAILLLCTASLVNNSFNPFLYFRF